MTLPWIDGEREADADAPGASSRRGGMAFTKTVIGISAPPPRIDVKSVGRREGQLPSSTRFATRSTIRFPSGDQSGKW